MAEPTDPAEGRTFTFEMALTAEEMVRLAAHLDPAHPIAAAGDRVAGRFGAPAVSWSMSIGAPRERAIGLFRFPIADVVLRIATADETIVARFLARFHLVFRKGGG